ncbi:MAG TPA: methionine biosynthesis protein MetW [Bryobacteraceae bacterium]|jgi:O-antigen chain-terminating methyltransferase|nr:methionine biosynthesis protein MetW [Bryobacteraceae bacterium]HVW09530.1 methionine biosynthesis protein MetW [Bryobacteraceae bacterium]
MDPNADQLTAMVEEIRTRVRARYPNGQTPSGAFLPDLSPLLHARDAAEGKVAAIGTVNPRPGGWMNSLVQSVKRLVSRALDWHVREQVEFNRAVMRCVQATFDALAETNRALVRVGAAGEMDLQTQLSEWRRGWEEQIAAKEITYLRNLSEIQTAFQHRVGILEAGMNERDALFRELVKSQHEGFQNELGRTAVEIQQKLWKDLAQVRADLDAVIHAELRVLRQRVSMQPPPAAVSTPAAAASSAPPPSAPDWSHVDWLRFSDRFRGSDDYVRRQQAIYAQRFAACTDVLDIGCGRGELLETLKHAGIPARGIELSAELAAICRARGLSVEQADLFEHLNGLPAESLGALACMQVVEHLPRPRVPEMIQAAFVKLRRGGIIAIETPNPECLAIFATHFYIDPTHRHPVPPALMAFYLEEVGFTAIEVERLSPAVETIPEVALLPDAFRDKFFGGMDYVIFGRKP